MSTPNLNLLLPAFGSGGWNTPLNSNFSSLDSFLSGVTPLPLSIALTQKIATYNGIATVANGVPSEYAAVDLTGQTAAIATTTLFTPTNAGQFRLSWNSKVTTVAGTSSTLGPLTITYTDPDGVVQTIVAVAQIGVGTIQTNSAGNLTTTVLLGLPILLNCKAGVAIQYAFGYASNAANVMAYNLHIRLESM
jgi:hypothetical protein